MKLTPWLLFYSDSSSPCHRRSRYVILFVCFLYIVTKPLFLFCVVLAVRVESIIDSPLLPSLVLIWEMQWRYPNVWL
jgi:hypothetical protein